MEKKRVTVDDYHLPTGFSILRNKFLFMSDFNESASQHLFSGE